MNVSRTPLEHSQTPLQCEVFTLLTTKSHNLLRGYPMRNSSKRRPYSRPLRRPAFSGNGMRVVAAIRRR
jgi:hypothetical protein